MITNFDTDNIIKYAEKIIEGSFLCSNDPGSLSISSTHFK